MNADGSAPTRITTDSFDDDTPSWQPVAVASGSVASVVVTPSTAAGPLGESAQFTATAYDAGGNLVSGKTATWLSSDSTIVRMNSTGYAWAVGVGSATLTAIVDGVSGHASATVTGVPIAKIHVDPHSVQNAWIGQTGWYVATLSDANGNAITGRPVVWTSTNPRVATIDNNGQAHAVGYGSAQIWASSGGVRDTAFVTVPEVPQPVFNLAVATISDTGATLQFTQTDNGRGSPSDYDIRFAPSPISWGTAASVSRGSCVPYVQGTAIGALMTCSVYGLTPGTAYDFQLVPLIPTSPGNGPTPFGPLSNVASARTTGQSGGPDTASVATVTVDPAEIFAKVGQSGTFTVTVKDANDNVLLGRTVTWSSSNTAAVTIDSNTGFATVVSGNTMATITATVGGKSGQATVHCETP